MAEVLESSYACQFMKLLIWVTHPHASITRQHLADGMAGGASERQSFCESVEIVRGDSADQVIVLAPE